MVYACKKFRHYLLRYWIVFHTDHDSLKYLVNKLDLSERITRWILLLQEFNYKVVVKPGKSNSIADFLSRQQGEEAVGDIRAKFLDEFPDVQDRKKETVFHLSGKEPSEFDDVISYIANRIYPPGIKKEEKIVFQYKVAPYSLIRGILFKMGANEQLRRCLERKDRKTVMRALHSGHSGSHFAAITIVNQIQSAGYWWPSLIRDVKN